MTRLVVLELRALARRWPLWTLPPLVVLVGWAMLPVNADAYLRYVNFDPQGPEQVLDNYRTDVWAVYTSGLGWAQLLALIAGAFLVLRDPRLARRPVTAAPADPAPGADPGPLLLAKAAAAAAGSIVLAAADLAAVLPNAHAHLANHPALAELRRGGVSVHELTLADRSVWTVIVCAVVNLALFSVIGVGLAAWAGRWWLVAATAGVLSLASLLFMAQDRIERFDGPLAALLPVLGVPALPWAMLWWLTLSPWAPVGVAVTLAVTVVVFLLGYRARRRRLISAATDGSDRPGGMPPPGRPPRGTASSTSQCPDK